LSKDAGTHLLHRDQRRPKSEWRFVFNDRIAEGWLEVLQNRDETIEQLSTELEESHQDVDRMVEMIKSKEQEHAVEFEKVRQKNSELTEMLDETIDKLDSSEKQLSHQATRIKECEV